MFGIDDAIAAGAHLIDDIVNKIAPDATQVEKDKMTAALQELNNQYALVLAQLKVNETEASSSHWFVAAWRPFVGWVCGLGLAYVSIIEPIARFVAVVLFKYAGVFPVINTEITMQILLSKMISSLN